MHFIRTQSRRSGLTLTGKRLPVHALLYNRKLALALWFGLSLFAGVQAVALGETNNFLIFRSVFPHLAHGQNLYTAYPQEYSDVNLYGPLFGLLIAPFSLLPVGAGAVLWVLFNTALLLYAIYQLPIAEKGKTLLVLLSAHELMASSSWLQSNAFVCACLLLGFAFTHKGKDSLALLFILLATFTKLLGVTGFAFLFFSKRPVRFLGWSLLWGVVLFFLPVVVTRYPFLLQSYGDWFHAIVAKNAKNDSPTAANVLYQNVSVIGLLRRAFGFTQMNDLVVLVPGFLAFASQYLHRRFFADVRYRLYILCSVLLSIVLFNTSSEAASYIIAMPALCLWYWLQPKTTRVHVFFACVFVFTTFLYSDLLTPWFREHVAKPYALKALPAFLVWVVVLVQIHRRQFLQARYLQPSAKPQYA